MYENDEILLGLREDNKRLSEAHYKRLTSIDTLEFYWRRKLVKLHVLEMTLDEMERNREDPDSVLSVNGMEMSIEEKTTEQMEETEGIIAEQRKSILELRKKHTEQREIIRALNRLMKALMEMSSGADVSVGVKMIGSIDLNALQNECNTNFLQDERLQELMKARDKERFEVEFIESEMMK